MDNTDEPFDLRSARRQKPVPSANGHKIDRLPPHALESEQGVLGCILISPQQCLAQTMTKLSGSEAFYDPRHQIIYEAMVAMQASGVAIDTVTLQDHLRGKDQLDMVGGLAYLSSLGDAVPSAANLDYYLDIVAEKYVLRRLIFACTDVVGRIYDYTGDTSRLVDEAERDILAVGMERLRGRNSGFVEVDRVQDEWLAKIDVVNENGTMPGLPTGYIDLDKLLGGLTAGEMVIIAARPSIGKTSFAMNMVENMSIRGDIAGGIFSMEMSAESLLHRSAASLARVNGRWVRNGGSKPEELLRYRMAHVEITNAYNAKRIMVCDRGALTIYELSAYARRMKMVADIKYLVIDYLQLCRGTRRDASMYETVTEVSAGVKALAKELGVAVVVLSQLNREVTKQQREPRLSDLRESGAIEQDGDVIMFLHPKDLSRETSNGTEVPNGQYAAGNNEAEPVSVIVAKNRNGPTDIVDMTFLRAYTRFEQAAKGP